jgi:hypothetical protein
VSEYNGVRRLLVLVLTGMTFACIFLAMKKFGGKTENNPPPSIHSPNTDKDGGFSKIPQEKVRPPIADGTLEQAVAAITEEQLKKDLYYLAGNQLEGRMSGKNGNKLAAEHIEAQFRKFGLETMRHRFPMSRFNPGPKNEQGDDFSENIYGILEGNDPNLKGEIVVVGAHMDHLGYGPKGSQAPNRKEIHPGADDNASGTVALLEIAHGFSVVRRQVKRTTVFMAFSGEEMGLIGSQYYVRNPVFPKGSPSIKNHVAMINMDMIGYLKKGTYLANFHNEGSSVDLDRAIGELNTKYSFAKNISGRGGGGSDHAPFYNAKVPVVCLHTGMHRQYHTPDDTADRINYKGLEQIARYAFELSFKVASGGDAPKFNYAEFKAMEYSHDHGYAGSPFHKEK